MTIKNFTFFSPNGTEFPVGSNNDGKLYMMLTGMGYRTIRRKDWKSPLNTALNVQYVNTSIVAGGRYFELLNETVALKGNKPGSRPRRAWRLRSVPSFSELTLKSL